MLKKGIFHQPITGISWDGMKVGRGLNINASLFLSLTHIVPATHLPCSTINEIPNSDVASLARCYWFQLNTTKHLIEDMVAVVTLPLWGMETGIKVYLGFI